MVRRTLRSVLNIVCLFVMCFVLVKNPTAYAINHTNNVSAIIRDTPYYDPGSVRCSASTGNFKTINLIGSENTEKIYRFFVAQGLTPEQAAGITGNAGAESSYNPTAVYDPPGADEYHGIFQWNQGRWPNLVKSAQSKGQDPMSLGAQLEFAWEEGNARGNINGLKQYPDVEHAAWYWGRFFEVAIIGGSTSTVPLTNVQSLETRIGNAKGVLARYGGVSGGGAPATSPTDSDTSDSASPPTDTTALSTGCAGTISGDATQFVDGFTIYSQLDPQWKDKPYSTSTIGIAGCGPTAMAMIITNLGQTVTPVDAADYAAKRGIYQEGIGSSWAIGPDLAEHWNLKSEKINATVQDISAALTAGKLVITAGKGAEPFTSGGHYIVIRALTSDGKWKVGDSFHADANNKAWDPQEILSSMSGMEGSVYAISK